MQILEINMINLMDYLYIANDSLNIKDDVNRDSAIEDDGILCISVLKDLNNQ